MAGGDAMLRLVDALCGPLPPLVRLFVSAYVAIHALTLMVFFWALAVEGPRLLDCLSAFVGE